MAVQQQRSIGLRTTVRSLDGTAATVQASLADARLPDGWRVQQVPGHLDATWHGPDGRWARFSLRFVPDEQAGGTVLVAFDCSIADGETLDSALELLEPLTAALGDR